MLIDRTFSLLLLIIFCISLNAQDQNVLYNDTLTKKLFQIKKDYSKREFESTYYTIQIYYGSLEAADLIFETPNYKVRIGEYKDINVASQKLEGIRRLYPGSFIIKLSEL